MRSSSLLLFWVHFFLFFNFNFLSLSTPFLPTKNVTLFGDAYFRNNAISLTQEISCLSSSSSSSSSDTHIGVGRAFYVYPIRFLDSETNATASFSCHFSFSIMPSPFCPSGDGIAFLMTDNAESFSPSRGYMGLPETEQDSDEQDSFFAVEFDTSYDPSLGDKNGNHVGIDANTIISLSSVDVVSRGIDLKSGRQITAWIEYRDDMKMIRVWLGYSQIRPPSPILVTQIDLSNQFKEFMHVGFSASNGQGSSIHIVDHWQFKTFGFLPSVIPMDAVEEGDCFMCFPEEPSMVSESSLIDDHARRKKLEELAFGLGGLAAFVVSLVAIVAVICFFSIKRRRHIKIKEGLTCRVQTNRLPAKLSLAEIKAATMGFNRNRIVGEGASAKVYKGSLPSGGEVAVKRFERTNGIESVRNPFTNEFATMVGCLRHKNLVQLQGWCCEGKVATGRKPVDDDGALVVDWVWNMWEKGKLIEAADPRLMKKFNVVEMERMLMVGLSCVHPDQEKRPPVKEVARILRGEAPLPLLPACKPRIRIRPVFPEDASAGDRPSLDDLPWMTPRSHFS
ncbi:hypothetical protein CMV_004771 [Castanea mollissima]|uniref:Protein kinase domain-containing protein n=1 Tax=Castanea mollissima TaxID=60419 RepID=A0A8J4VTF1_9ROSI|nr:hypothetical protein CMV_004771 [Castanea mollissima]